MANIKQIEQNKNGGKDYVFGDLHGYIHKLDAAIQALNFDPSKDRLFSVGDLCNGGTDSMACLALLDKDYFYAVRGNNEDYVLRSIHKIQQNGLTTSVETYLNEHDTLWLMDLSAEEQQELYEKLQDLPYVLEIEVDGQDTPVAIVHSPPYANEAWADYTKRAALFSLDTPENEIYCTSHAKKVIEERKSHGPIEGVYRLFFGHKPFLTGQIMKLSDEHGNGNAYNLDSGGGTGEATGVFQVADILVDETILLEPARLRSVFNLAVDTSQGYCTQNHEKTKEPINQPPANQINDGNKLP